MLDSVTELIRVMADSKQYQHLTTSDHYYADELNLNDAIEAMENVSTAFCDMHRNGLDPAQEGVLIEWRQSPSDTQQQKQPS